MDVSNGHCDIKCEIELLKKENKLKDAKIRELESVVDKLRSVLDQSQMMGHQKSPGIKERFLFKRTKKQGVSAESWGSSKPLELIYHAKNTEVRHIIREALLKNHMLRHLELRQINEIIECMQEKKIESNANVIEENGEANNLYVVQMGNLDVYKDKTKISDMGPRTTFGEVALLYNCKRTATVKATTSCILWVLDRASFQAIMRKTCTQRQEELLVFLKSVPVLKPLSDCKLMKLAASFEQQQYDKKECILREGEQANSFFIIQSGSALVTQKEPNTDIEKSIRTLNAGDFFGEKALLSGGVRTASVYAADDKTEILSLYRKDFLELVGNLGEIKNIDYGDEERYKHLYDSNELIRKYVKDEDHIPIAMSEIVRLKTLGVGGFGRVYLVKINGDESKSYALKCMKKAHILKMKQQTHVLSEKKLLSEIDSPFICKLYQTYKDNQYVYMLTEVCLGGELWSILRDKVFFTDSTTRFCLSCVVEAFEYLHKRGIIYRDLKPENLLVDHRNGYLKLCDFGFAKQLTGGKRTWTFCGTPEYVSPEIILNKSHDNASDLWSLGILTFELLTGMPPFTASDPIKIYAMTLKGVENLDISHNKRISSKASSLILQLCRKNAHERLGYGRNGLDDIRTHKYFQGFDWQKSVQLNLTSPFITNIKDEFDGSNFDDYPDDHEDAPIEISGWDAEF